MISLPREIEIKNTSGEIAPALGVGEIVGYNVTLGCVEIDKPSADGLEAEKLVFIPFDIPIDCVGIGYIDGIHAVGLHSGETDPEEGDTVGTYEDSWFTKVGEGQLRVIYVTTESYVVCTKIGGSGTGTSNTKADIFEVVSNATGTGVYNCKKKAINEDNWDDNTGADKFLEHTLSTVEVLNVVESKVGSNSHNLAAGDRLITWKISSKDSRIITNIGRDALWMEDKAWAYFDTTGVSIGDSVIITDVETDPTLNGTFEVEDIETDESGTYIVFECPGEDAFIDNEGLASKEGVTAVSHYVGIPYEKLTGIRKAYCKNAAGAAATITCYLDTDGTGEEVTVNCSITGGGNLNSAIPRLADGTLIFVTSIGGTWYCVGTFQASENCTCTSP